MDRLKGKVAIVVGAGSIGPGWGNGKATAVTFAREGASVLCVDVNPAAAAETAGIIQAEGGSAAAHRADVTKADEVAAMVEACRDRYGRTNAVEYAKKRIRVNAVVPGLMKTPMVEKAFGFARAYGAADVEEMWRVRDAQVPMGFGGEAWDVAWAAVYLASEESRYVTGIELVVDGGLT